MFFRLDAIDDRRLPCRTLVDGHEYDILRGGLLLEPPVGSRQTSEAHDGHSILKLFGNPGSAGRDGLVVASMEPYRFAGPGRIAIARRTSEHGARFRGAMDGDVLQLWAEPDGAFLVADTRLTLTAAPGDPITDAWTNTFNFGPPMVQPVEHWRQDDPAVRAQIDRAIAAAEPARLRAVQERLENAWRAPA